jgi:hypothetical protein
MYSISLRSITPVLRAAFITLRQGITNGTISAAQAQAQFQKLYAQLAKNEYNDDMILAVVEAAQQKGFMLSSTEAEKPLTVSKSVTPSQGLGTQQKKISFVSPEHQQIVLAAVNKLFALYKTVSLEVMKKELENITGLLGGALPPPEVIEKLTAIVEFRKELETDYRLLTGDLSNEIAVAAAQFAKAEHKDSKQLFAFVEHIKEVLHDVYLVAHQYANNVFMLTQAQKTAEAVTKQFYNTVQSGLAALAQSPNFELVQREVSMYADAMRDIPPFTQERYDTHKRDAFIALAHDQLRGLIINQAYINKPLAELEKILDTLRMHEDLFVFDEQNDITVMYHYLEVCYEHIAALNECDEELVEAEQAIKRQDEATLKKLQRILPHSQVICDEIIQIHKNLKSDSLRKRAEDTRKKVVHTLKQIHELLTSLELSKLAPGVVMPEGLLSNLEKNLGQTSSIARGALTELKKRN